MRDFTESELVDLQIKYKNDQTVLDLIAFVKVHIVSYRTNCPMFPDENESDS